jgi:hypothetical protein
MGAVKRATPTDRWEGGVEVERRPDGSRETGDTD